VDAVGSVVPPFEAVVAARIGGIGAKGEALVPGHGRVVPQRETLAVAPESGRVVGMGVGLAVVAEEAGETLPVWIALRPEVAQPPFPEGSAGIAGGLQGFGEGGVGGGERMLPLGLGRGVVADGGVAGMPAGHENAARGGADRVAGV